jgi:chemotaxis protein methyltransferase CheR
MRDADCIAFLQWALPRMNMRWPGFRKVRRQVCKRIARRMKELDQETVDQYRDRLVDDEDEWLVLDAACRITISRFYRDKHVFDVLADSVLPAIFERALKEGRPVRCWCAGCASGEEAYTLTIVWDIVIRPAFPGVDFDIIGTDADPVMISRAEKACYAPGSLKDMPPEWLDRAFDKSDDEFCVAARCRRRVTILSQDIRDEMPEGPFDLVLCRNLVLTYFDTTLQSEILKQITARLRPGGYIVIGAHEKLPEGNRELEAVEVCREILRHANGRSYSSEGS